MKTSSENKEFTCGFVGLGLIGGSIARALRRYWDRDETLKILAYTPHASTVEEAMADMVVDAPVDADLRGFADCDLIFLCAPVEDNDRNLEKLSAVISPETTVTDIGSVKNDIHRVVERLHLEKQFVGGHPMTGTERTGYRNSKASLMENAYYVLTRAPGVDEARLSMLSDLVSLMKATPIVVDHQMHDYVTAAISHVPHVISASLVNLVKNSDNDDHLMKTLAAGGFKDITRISSSSPVMWEQICLTNRENITQLLDRYIESLNRIRKSIDSQDSDALMDFFSCAREYRESFVGNFAGPIARSYIIHVDIADQPGNLATVATLLSVNGINIKNLGIVHNREYEHGTLSIELHDEASMEKAGEILAAHGYPLIA